MAFNNMYGNMKIVVIPKKLGIKNIRTNPIYPLYFISFSYLTYVFSPLFSKSAIFPLCNISNKNITTYAINHIFLYPTVANNKLVSISYQL